MAERMKDAEDRWLESLLASESVADDGFSTGIVRRISRRIWLRRLTVPVAAAIGAAIAFQPLAGLLRSLDGLATLVPASWMQLAAEAVPQLQLIVIGGMILVVGLVGTNALQD